MNNFIKKAGVILLALCLILSLAACGGNNNANNSANDMTEADDAAENPAENDVNTEAAENPDEGGENRESGENAFAWETVGDAEENSEPVTARIAALKGPTAMGLVKFMSDAENDNLPGDYDFTLAASPDEVTPLLIKGDLDIACVPANLSAVLYNRTEGDIITLAINTLGVLYIVETGENIQNMMDLRGKTIVASGKGATPEYALRFLFMQYGLDPDKDVSIDWKSEHSECVAALASGAAEIAMLPQPFVTVAQGNLENLRVALDLTREWNEITGDYSALITGVVAARREFVENHPNIIGHFLDNYANSVEWVNANVTDAAALIGEYDIVAAPVAEKALPYCNIVCITGEKMKDLLSGYLYVLEALAPESIGGAVPEDDFYYQNDNPDENNALDESPDEAA